MVLLWPVFLIRTDLLSPPIFFPIRASNSARASGGSLSRHAFHPSHLLSGILGFRLHLPNIFDRHFYVLFFLSHMMLYILPSSNRIG
jgi:hypothetical protein